MNAFFPPPKTPENAAYWPFPSQEAMDQADRSIEECKKRRANSDSAYSAGAFHKFLEDGAKRCPNLYKEKR